MTTEETIQKIRGAKTMPELNDLRELTVTMMMSGGKEAFERVQREFIKSKNRLIRIPLKDRTW